MKNHIDLSSEDSKQLRKSILNDIIDDIPNKDEIKNNAIYCSLEYCTISELLM